MNKRLLNMALALGLLASITTSAVGCTAPANSTPARESVTATQTAPALQRKLSLAQILELAEMNPDFVKQRPDKKYIPSAVQEQFNKQVNAYFSQQRLVHGDPISVNALPNTPVEYIFFLGNTQQYAGLVKKANDALYHGMNYWLHDSIPRVDWQIMIPKNESELSEKQPEDRLNIYAVKGAGTLYPYAVTATYPNGSVLALDLVINETTFGEAHRSIKFNISESGVNVAQTTENLLWVIDNADPLTYTTPALEVLHAQISAIALDYLASIVQQNPGISEAKLNMYAESLLILEELMVHGGIGLNWKHQLNTDFGLGLTEEQLVKSETWMNRYPLQIAKTAERVRELGVGQAIDFYDADITGFFEGIVNFIK